MNSVILAAYKSRCFSTSTSKASSSVPWISPLHYGKSLRRPDPPTETSSISVDLPRKPKFVSHDSAVNLMRALDFFNRVSSQRGFSHNNSTYAVILHKLGQCKKFEAIHGVLHQMTYETCKLHEGIFLNLMTHFLKSSLHERVLEMFNAIQPIVLEKPSLKAISTCLNLLVDSDQVDLARTFLLNTKKNHNLIPNTCIFNILVKHHCKNGDIDSAFEVFKEMKESGKLQEAIDLFEEMVSKDQILPDALIYNVLISGFCRRGKVDRATKIMEFMRKNGCDPNIFNYSSLMNGFCKEGRLQEAKEIFNEMKSAGLKPDKVTYTTLINCLCRAGGIDEAINLLKEMEDRKCKADVVSFNVILVGLCKEGRLDEALCVLERLFHEGVHLNKSSYRIVLNSMLSEGELQKATELLDMMLDQGFVPHFATSNELLVRLCEAGRPADAAMVLCGLVEMGFKPEPEAWSLLIELMCRGRKLLATFQLIDGLAVGVNHE